MPRLMVTVKVNGRPLRRAYVEHLVFGVVTETYMTDNSGRIRDKEGNLGIDSLTPNADIRVLCQNSVARVLNGAALNIAVHQDRSITDRSTVNLNTNAHQDDYYAILNRCLLVYDVVFRQFRPFSHGADKDFPLGRQSSLSASKDQNKRIEVSFPSQFPLGSLAFTEPKSISTDFPLIHFRDRSSDGKLFGEQGERPTLIPAELAHALHFSFFSSLGRQQIETDYIGWIASDIANGGEGTHGMGVRTSPKVAYIEALDHFSTRFAEFVRIQVQGGTSTLLRQQAMTAQIRSDFIDKEVSGSHDAVAKLDASGSIVPNDRLNLKGADDEGSNYGCIFVDFARRVGLRTAVNAYLRSAEDGAISFGQYKTWISNNQRQHLNHLIAAQQTWGL